MTEYVRDPQFVSEEWHQVWCDNRSILLFVFSVSVVPPRCLFESNGKGDHFKEGEISEPCALAPPRSKCQMDDGIRFLGVLTG